MPPVRMFHGLLNRVVVNVAHVDYGMQREFENKIRLSHDTMKVILA